MVNIAPKPIAKAPKKKDPLAKPPETEVVETASVAKSVAKSSVSESNLSESEGEADLRTLTLEDVPVEERIGWIAPPTDLIFDDGEPLESNRHRVAMNALIDSYQHYRSPATDFYAAGNMFVYYSSTQKMNKEFRGPDFFVVLDVDGLKERQGWVVWEEGGRYPDVIVELMSRSTKKVDTGVKKDLYNQIFKTTDYFVYDPFDPRKFQGWHLSNGRYEELEKNDRGWLWSEKLGLWLGSWHGTIGCETTYWPRFYQPNGDLVMLASEAEACRAEAESQRAEAESQRAEAESQRAARLAARLRELGEDPDLI